MYTATTEQADDQICIIVVELMTDVEYNLVLKFAVILMEINVCAQTD